MKILPAQAATAQPRELLPAIDGFRGLATLTVVLTHAWLLSGSARLGGGFLQKLVAGGVVDYFFVISGFVLFLPAMYNSGSLGDLRSYAIRRAARIIPLYYLSLVLVLALHGMITDPAEHIRLPFVSLGAAGSFVMHLLFLQNFVLPMHQEIGFGNGVVWTLPLELVFYLLLPLVAMKFYRRPFLMLAISIAVTQLWKLGVGHLTSLDIFPSMDTAIRWQVSLMHAPTYFTQFALGMTGAWTFVKIRQGDLATLRRWAPPAMLVSLAFILRDILAQGADRIAGQPLDLNLKTSGLALWFTVLVVATLVAPEWAQWPLSNRFARWMGTISYGFYLFHLIAIRFALHTLGFSTDGTAGSFLAMLAFATVASMAMGHLSYRYVERPIRRWAVAKTRRPKPEPEPDPSVATATAMEPPVSQLV